MKNAEAHGGGASNPSPGLGFPGEEKAELTLEKSERKGAPKQRGQLMHGPGT